MPPQANELELALDVYGQLLREGCTPNLVTYNILIDVHGKTGAWQEAVQVLDALEAQVHLHPCCPKLNGLCANWWLVELAVDSQICEHHQELGGHDLEIGMLPTTHCRWSPKDVRHGQLC